MSDFDEIWSKLYEDKGLQSVARILSICYLHYANSFYF